MRADGEVHCGQDKSGERHEYNSNTCREKVQTKKHQTLEALDSSVPRKRLSSHKGSQRCHLLIQTDLVGKCHRHFFHAVAQVCSCLCSGGCLVPEEWGKVTPREPFAGAVLHKSTKTQQNQAEIPIWRPARAHQQVIVGHLN